MWTLEDLTAMLSQPIPGSNNPVLGCIKRPLEEVSHLQDENSWQRKRLTAAWSPQVRLDRAEVLQHPAFREASSGRPAPAEPSAPLLQVKQEQEEQWISPEGAGEEDLPQGPSWARPVKTEDGEEPAPPSPPQPEAAPATRDPEPYVKQEPQQEVADPEQQEAPGPRVREEEAAAAAAAAAAAGGETGAGSARDAKPGLGPAKFMERVYPCPLCGLECVSQAHLRTHMRVHTGERPYSCPDCRKAYTTKGALNRHVRSFHRGDRPFRCQFCMFSFTFKSGLERHLRVHTGERPFTCSFCGLGFTQSGNLATHINVHHRVSSLKYKMKA